MATATKATYAGRRAVKAGAGGETIGPPWIRGSWIHGGYESPPPASYDSPPASSTPFYPVFILDLSS